MPLDLLSKIRGEIDERLEELRPLLAEHERLLDAGVALEQADSDTLAAGAIERGVRSEQTDSDLLKGQSAKAGSSAKPSRRGPTAVWEHAGQAVRPKSAPGARNAANATILAALEHGSHTVSELAVVTAMTGPSINASLRKLVSEGTVVKTERECKTAWALATGA